MLYGRRAQCDTLERLLADARRSRSGVLVVRGEAGAGKSALLGFAAGRAEDMLVLRSSGGRVRGRAAVRRASPAAPAGAVPG